MPCKRCSATQTACFVVSLAVAHRSFTWSQAWPSYFTQLLAVAVIFVMLKCTAKQLKWESLEVLSLMWARRLGLTQSDSIFIWQYLSNCKPLWRCCLLLFLLNMHIYAVYSALLLLSFYQQQLRKEQTASKKDKNNNNSNNNNDNVKWQQTLFNQLFR